MKAIIFVLVALALAGCGKDKPATPESTATPAPTFPSNSPTFVPPAYTPTPTPSPSATP